MHVTIDRAGCIACGQCVSTCPSVFDMASDGLAEVIKQPGPEHEAEVHAAAEGCPTAVISTQD